MIMFVCNSGKNKCVIEPDERKTIERFFIVNNFVGPDNLFIFCKKISLEYISSKQFTCRIQLQFMNNEERRR